jgi:hypothetical protein
MTCGAVKPLAQFVIAQAMRDGHKNRCRSCERARLEARIVPVPVAAKRCPSCGATKPLDAFYRQKYGRYGRKPTCKLCETAGQRAARAADPERRRAVERRWWAAHGAATRPRRKRWHVANLQRCRLKAVRRRARIRQAEGSFTQEDMAALYAAQDGRCAYCATLLNGRYHIEHKQPLSRGGTNWPDNLCCACPRCNWRKFTKTDAEFRAMLGHHP